MGARTTAWWLVVLAACGGGEPAASDARDNPASDAADRDAATADAAPGSGLSDSFDGAAIDLLADNTSAWSLLHPERASQISMASGRLDIVARHSEDVSAHNGWYQDDYGPLVYKNVTGDFAVAVRLRVYEHGNPGAPPSGDFKAGGVVVRDPAGTHAQNENWIMYNMGQNSGAYQREVKKTTSSISGLYLNPQAFVEQGLLVCRVDGRFYFYAWDAGATAWVVERYQPAVTINQSSVVAEVDTTGAMPMYFEDGLPGAVQVGIMGHAWSYAGNTSQTHASYDWVAFRDQPPATLADCTAGFDGFALP